MNSSHWGKHTSFLSWKGVRKNICSKMPKPFPYSRAHFVKYCYILLEVSKSSRSIVLRTVLLGLSPNPQWNLSLDFRLNELFSSPWSRKVNHRVLSDFQNLTLGFRCSYLYHKILVRKYTKYLQKGLKWKQLRSQRAPGYVMCQLTLVPISFVQHHLNNFNSFSVLVYIQLYCVKKTLRKL